MNQKPLKEKLCLSLDPEVVKQLKELAEKDDRSLSSYVNRILRDYLKESVKMNKSWKSTKNIRIAVYAL